MKKTFLLLSLATLIVVFLISSTNACVRNPLDVSVSCYPEEITLGQNVTITCTANMSGKGKVFVIQPVDGASMASSESEDIKDDLNKISSDTCVSLCKTISYALVNNITGPEGGEQEFTFPDDFTGLNGEPNTNTRGKYYVFFIFRHQAREHVCKHVCKIDFDCSSILVIPESPIGILIAGTASLGIVLGLKRLRTKRLAH